MKNLGEFLGDLTVGAPQSFHNLTMTPLLGDSPAEADYLLLDQAMEENHLEVSEISDAGSVPDIKVLNKSSKRVLMLDGEELIGAKQNRILNVSVMAPAEQSITIPVSCVEAGRWRHRTENFSSAGRTHYAEGRAAKTQAVNRSMRFSGSRRGSQGEVWANISAKATRMDAQSDTAASEEIFRKHRLRLDEYLTAFSALPNQIGAVFAVDGATTGVDLFDSTQALAGSFDKLVESYALDAIDLRYGGASSRDKINVKKLLGEISAAAVESYPAVGEGEDYRFDSHQISGGALVIDQRIVHLCAFHILSEDRRETRRTRMASAYARSSNRRAQSG